MGAIAKPCQFGRILAQYADDEDRATVADQDVSHQHIWEQTTDHYAWVSLTTIKMHRYQRCTCFRGEHGRDQQSG